MNTHVVILAAGRGSRLGPLADDTSKWLLAVGADRIADRQLDAVAKARRAVPAAIASVSVVTGYAGRAVEHFLRDRDETDVCRVRNPEFANLNNWYSVLLALESIDIAGNDGVVILNGDLFAEPTWLARFLVDSATGAAEALVAVDLERELVDESMKVAASPTSNGGGPMLARIGKSGVGDPVGEYVGMLMARGAALAAFRRALRAFVGRPERASEWYEKAVDETAATGVTWTIWPTPSSAWVEIDDRDDYAAALELARKS